MLQDQWTSACVNFNTAAEHGSNESAQAETVGLQLREDESPVLPTAPALEIDDSDAVSHPGCIHEIPSVGNLPEGSVNGKRKYWHVQKNR